jgi:hypothetical protein
MLSQFDYQEFRANPRDDSSEKAWYSRLTVEQKTELNQWYLRLIRNNENYIQLIKLADRPELTVLSEHKANFAIASEAVPVLKPADITLMYKIGKLITNKTLKFSNPEAVNGFERLFRTALNVGVAGTVLISAATATRGGDDVNCCDCGNANCDNCCNPETLAIPVAATAVVILTAGTTAYSVNKFIKSLVDAFWEQKKFLKSGLRLIATPSGYLVGMIKGGSIGASVGMPVFGTVIGGIVGAGIATGVSKYTGKLISMITAHLGFYGPVEFLATTTNASKYFRPGMNATTARMFVALRDQKNDAGFFRRIPCTQSAEINQQFNDLCAQMRKVPNPETYTAWAHNFFWNQQTGSWGKLDQNAIPLVANSRVQPV